MTVLRRVGDRADARPLRSLRPAERRILNAIRQEPDQSRAMLAKRLGLSPALLSGTVSTFLDEGWITERRLRAPSRRGQPALLLRIEERTIAGLGISLSTGGIAASCVDLSGRVLRTTRHATNAQDLAGGVPVAEHAISDLLDSADSFAGITIWVPAMIAASGEIVEVTPSQRGVDFNAYRSALQDRFGLPVHLESKCQAIDEAMNVADPDAVVFTLFLDYGIGGSLIDRLRVFRGGFGQAVNIGALMPEPGIRPSLPDLARFLGLDSPEPSFALMSNATGAKKDRLDTWIRSRGKALSDPLSAVTQLLNPTDVVLGGLFPEWILEGLMAEVRLDLYDVEGRVPIGKPKLRIARVVGEDALSISAASVSVFRALSDPDRDD
jgi:predicted NBD/HSP70 family sugar kinase